MSTEEVSSVKLSSKALDASFNFLEATYTLLADQLKHCKFSEELATAILEASKNTR